MSSFQHMLHKALNSIYNYNIHNISLLFFPLLLSLVFLYKLWRPSTRNHPPSPPKLPVLGHLHQLGAHPHLSLRSLSRRYGELMLIHLGNKPTLIVSSASMAKQIMKTHDMVFSNRPKLSITDKLLYYGRDVSFAPYGEYWRQMKSICVLQLLSNTRVRSYRVIREEETSLLIEKIYRQSKYESTAVNLSELLMELTNDVVCRVAFGRKYTENQQLGIDFKELLRDFTEIVGGFSIGDFIPWMGWINRFNGLDEKLENVAKKFDVLLENIISEHLDKFNKINGDGNNYTGSHENENKAKDFVDILLEVQRENSAGFPIERDSIKALLLDAFAAGTDTTYTVIEWAMTELLRHPEVMQHLQEEVRGIMGSKEHIIEDDLAKMIYLKAVIKETLRLHPPIPLLVFRESSHDSKINGYDIAARTLVIINACAIQRDPVTWEEPEDYQPERFLNSSIDFKGHHFELVPFGGGRRICPGISFAIASIELVLANLVHKFNWKLPAEVKAETLDMSESTGLTMHRKTPLLAVATSSLC